MPDKFSLLRKALTLLGFPQDRVDEIIGRIQEWLAEDEAAAQEGGKRPAFSYPYRRAGPFLSPAELAFYRALLPATAGWAVVCPKVRLGDLFKAVTPDHGEWLRANSKIQRKHVDFLLCDPHTMRPLLGVELDDRSHRRQDRQERDAFVARTFATAGLPLAAVRVQSHYPPERLARFLRQKAGLSAEPDAQPAKATVADEGPQAEAAPACPTCGAPMVLRTAKRGRNAGNHFWGCSTYPQCRGMLAYEAGR